MKTGVRSRSLHLRIAWRLQEMLTKRRHTSIMSTRAFSSAPDFDAERALILVSEQTFRMMAVARALVESHRQVDVEGIQEQVGLVCARALDLAPARSRLARAELHRLIQGLDALHVAMREKTA